MIIWLILVNKDDNLIDFKNTSMPKRAPQTGNNFFNPHLIPQHSFGMQPKQFYYPGISNVPQFSNFAAPQMPKHAGVRNNSVRKVSDDIFNLGTNQKTPKKIETKTEDFFKF